MDKLYDVLIYISNFLWNKVLFFTLIPIGIAFTILSKAAQFRHFGRTFKGLFSNKKKDTATISSLQALLIGVASRVGVGNLTGVAIAVSLGGAGAVFWMWCVALLGMSTSIIENSLSLLYRQRQKNGNFFGGSSYYILHGIGGLKGKVLAICFAFSLLLCFGLGFNAVQAHSVQTALSFSFETLGWTVDASWWIAILLAAATLFIIFGGIKRIAVVSQVIVPFMGGLYVLAGLYVIFTHLPEFPKVLTDVFSQAWGVQAAGGGIAGGVIRNALNQGVRRGLFSNEAGLGSAPNVAASANVTHPVEQGLVQALGVFIDTLVICTITAMVVILGGQLDSSLGGIEIAQRSFNNFFGKTGLHFLTLMIFFFGFTSIIGNYSYCEANLLFLSGKNYKIFLPIFRCFAVIVVFVGALSSAAVWNIADLFMAIMASINLFALIWLAKKGLALLKDYDGQLKNGHVRPEYGITKPLEDNINWPKLEDFKSN